MLVGYTVKLVTITILYIYMYMVNKKRDRDAAARLLEDPSAASQEEREAIENGMLVWFFSSFLSPLCSLDMLTICQDQTEIDNKGFRYIL